jgi:hypothetical protein
VTIMLTWGFAGALGGTRTPNLLIRSQMLYPLSYERWCLASLRHSEPVLCRPGRAGQRTRIGSALRRLRTARRPNERALRMTKR